MNKLLSGVSSHLPWIRIKSTDFYKQFTLDFTDPLSHLHLSIDAPIQLYALLYVPSTTYNPSFSLRKQDGLQLYCRNILLQEFSRDLLPDYLRFIQGVVDSEDTSDQRFLAKQFNPIRLSAKFAKFSQVKCWIN